MISIASDWHFPCLASQKDIYVEQRIIDDWVSRNRK